MTSSVVHRVAAVLLLFCPATAWAAAPRAFVNLGEFTKPNDSKDDTQGLLKAIDAAYIVRIDAGVWDFSGPLIAGEHAGFGRCRIVGQADESAVQHQEEDRQADRFVSQLNIRGLKRGQHWIDWKPARLPDGKADRGGPMAFENTSVVIHGEGCFMRLGDAASEDALGVDLRKLDLTGLYVSAPEQLANKFDGQRLPPWSHDAMIEIIRGYDVKVSRLGIRGGGVQLRLRGCDRPDVKNFHSMLGVVGLSNELLAGAAGVAPATASDLHFEHYAGSAVYATNIQIDRVRAETGREVIAGAESVKADWKIAKGTNRVEVSGINCLERIYRGAVVYVSGTPLVATAIDEAGFTFAEGDSHCWFAQDASGASFGVCYGVGVVGLGDRFTLGAWSVDFNKKSPRLPVGAFAPHCETIVVGPYAQGISEFMDDSNRAIVVGHCAGRQYAVEGGVHFLSSRMNAHHPLASRGVGPTPDPNWCRWLGIWAGNDESKNLRFRKIDQRWTVRLDDSPTGWTRPAAEEYRFDVLAEEPTTLGVYPGFGATREHKLAKGWQTVAGKFPRRGKMLLLGPCPASVALEDSDEDARP